MNFDELVKHIKNDGCRIHIYRSRMFIGDAVGTFQDAECGPIIFLATKGWSKAKFTRFLLHEYGHYLQWKDKFWHNIWSVCEAEDIWQRWITYKIELTPIEHQAARNSQLWSEWDAEMRGYNQGKALNIYRFNSKVYLKSALSYMASIKWGWENRKSWNISIPIKHIKNPRILTIDELYAPLTTKELAATKFIK